MSNASIGLSQELHAYLVKVGVREPDVLRRLRERTAAIPEHGMQIAPAGAAARGPAGVLRPQPRMDRCGP